MAEQTKSGKILSTIRQHINRQKIPKTVDHNKSVVIGSIIIDSSNNNAIEKPLIKVERDSLNKVINVTKIKLDLYTDLKKERSKNSFVDSVHKWEQKMKDKIQDDSIPVTLAKYYESLLATRGKSAENGDSYITITDKLLYALANVRSNRTVVIRGMKIYVNDTWYFIKTKELKDFMINAEEFIIESNVSEVGTWVQPKVIIVEKDKKVSTHLQIGNIQNLIARINSNEKEVDKYHPKISSTCDVIDIAKDSGGTYERKKTLSYLKLPLEKGKEKQPFLKLLVNHTSYVYDSTCDGDDIRQLAPDLIYKGATERPFNIDVAKNETLALLVALIAKVDNVAGVKVNQNTYEQLKAFIPIKLNGIKEANDKRYIENLEKLKVNMTSGVPRREREMEETPAVEVSTLPNNTEPVVEDRANTTAPVEIKTSEVDIEEKEKWFKAFTKFGVQPKTVNTLNNRLKKLLMEITTPITEELIKYHLMYLDDNDILKGNKEVFDNFKEKLSNTEKKKISKNIQLPLDEVIELYKRYL